MNQSNVGRRLIFADGTTYENAECGYSGGVLVLFMQQTITLQEAAALAFNQSKTASVRFEYGEMHDTYEGFTRPIYFGEDADHNVTISLKRGE